MKPKFKVGDILRRPNGDFRFKVENVSSERYELRGSIKGKKWLDISVGFPFELIHKEGWVLVSKLERVLE